VFWTPRGSCHPRKLLEGWGSCQGVRVRPKLPGSLRWHTMLRAANPLVMILSCCLLLQFVSDEAVFVAGCLLTDDVAQP